MTFLGKMCQGFMCCGRWNIPVTLLGRHSSLGGEKPSRNIPKLYGMSHVVDGQFTQNIARPLGENKLCLFPVSLSPGPDPFEAFIIFSIRHEIRRIDLHKRDYSLLVPGLRNTIALDFHFNRSLLYWTDVVEDKIYRGRLSETGGMCM